MSEGHAELIAAFVLNEYDSISEAAAKIDAQYFECGVAEDESAESGSPSKLVDATAVLKQNLFYHNNSRHSSLPIPPQILYVYPHFP